MKEAFPHYLRCATILLEGLGECVGKLIRGMPNIKGRYQRVRRINMVVAASCLERAKEDNGQIWIRIRRNYLVNLKQGNEIGVLCFLFAPNPRLNHATILLLNDKSEYGMNKSQKP